MNNGNAGYRLESNTVIVTDHYGEEWDLNAEGEDISEPWMMAQFIKELHQQRIIDNVVEQQLLQELQAQAAAA